jgi:YNFM family putative membrane transporter
MRGFLVGAAGMFAAMYSTQAVLPEIGRDFGVSPSEAGLTISVVLLAIAASAWFWGSFSDRVGRRRAMVLASALLVLPTVGAGLAPTFGALLACRAAQGLCMPGLLIVGVPYVVEAFTPRIGGRAMGNYVAALVAGGLIGRVGVALVAQWAGWRWGVGGLAVLPLAAAVVMHRSLPRLPPPERGGGARGALRNLALLRVTAVGAALFFTFVGTFSFVVYRLEEPPFSYGTAAGGMIFLLWLLGAVGPSAGRLVDRIGWRRTALAAVCTQTVGLLLSLPDALPTLVLGLGLVTVAMFAGVTAAQLGVGAAASADRGAASALYFTVYYSAAALGGYVPGLAWEAWGWGGVTGAGLASLAVAATAVSSRRPAGLRR